MHFSLCEQNIPRRPCPMYHSPLLKATASQSTHSMSFVGHDSFGALISVTDVLCDIYYNSPKKGTLGEGRWLIMYMTLQTCLNSSSLQTKENMSNYYIMWFVHVGITVVHGRSRRRESRRSVIICQLSRIFIHQFSVWWQEMLSVHGNTPVVREKRNLQTGSV